MRELQVLPVRTALQKRQFLTFPWKIYKNDPLWVPPLLPARRKTLDPQRGLFFKNGYAEAFIAWRKGRPVGTIVCAEDKNNTQTRGYGECMIGFFECVEDFEVAEARAGPGPGRACATVVGTALITPLRTYLLAASATAVFALPPQAAPAPAPAELARLVQQKYDTVRGFSASFEHRYRGGVLRKEAVERGTMQVKKPSRMRWTYESPERKVFVADGTRIYSYIPEDRQVIVAPVPAETEATTPALFLSGHGSLSRDFEASFPPEPDPAPGTYSLKLVPHRREAEYDWLVLVVDRGTYRLRKLITADAQGGQSTFTFTDVRENAGVPDSAFRFTIPRGVHVVTHEQARR